MKTLIRSHPVPKVSDIVTLNDYGIRQIFGTGSVESLQHMKTLKMKVIWVDSMSATAPPRLTFPVEVDNTDINRYLIDHWCFDIAK